MIKFLIDKLAGRALTCQEVTSFLTDYSEGALDPETTKRFENHLSACKNCETYMNQYRSTVRLLHDLPVPPPPPELAAYTRAFLEARLKDR